MPLVEFQRVIDTNIRRPDCPLFEDGDSGVWVDTTRPPDKHGMYETMAFAAASFSDQKIMYNTVLQQPILSMTWEEAHLNHMSVVTRFITVPGIVLRNMCKQAHGDYD